MPKNLLPIHMIDMIGYMDKDKVFYIPPTPKTILLVSTFLGITIMPAEANDRETIAGVGNPLPITLANN